MTTSPRPKGRRWQHGLDVIGLKFRFTKSGRRAVSDMIDKRGSITGIRLEREPDNPADANAIKVLLPERILEGKQLGYIRATSAEILAPKLDSGALAVASARLEALDPAEDYNVGNMLVTFIDVAKPRQRKVKT